MKKLLILIMMLPITVIANSANDALDVHNNWRINVNAGLIDKQPKPSPPIPLMEWDETLASQAQDYADTCANSHASYDERFGAGENLAWGYSVTDAVDIWAKEHSEYQYPNGFSSSTGHYTQVVWSNSVKLGCGWNPSCSMTVCRYNSHGNFNNRAPYDTGDSTISNLYTKDFTIKNIIFNNHYYSVKMNDLSLYSLELSNYDEPQPINYIHLLNDKYTIYLPKVNVGDIEYSVLLEYQDSGKFEVPFFIETRNN